MPSQKRRMPNEFISTIFKVNRIEIEFTRAETETVINLVIAKKELDRSIQILCIRIKNIKNIKKSIVVSSTGMDK